MVSRRRRRSRRPLQAGSEIEAVEIATQIVAKERRPVWIVPRGDRWMICRRPSYERGVVKLVPPPAGVAGAAKIGGGDGRSEGA